MLTICVSPTGDTQIVNIQVRAFGIPARRRRGGMPTHFSYPLRRRRAPLNKGGLFSRWISVVFIHAWRGSAVSTKVDTYQQQKSVEGGVGPVAGA